MNTKRRDASKVKPAPAAHADTAAPGGGKHADNLRRINAAGVPGSSGGATSDLAATDRSEARTDKPRNGFRDAKSATRKRKPPSGLGIMGHDDDDTRELEENKIASSQELSDDDERSINSGEDRGDDAGLLEQR